MIGLLFGKVKLWLAAAGAVAIAVLLAFLKGRSAGETAAEARRNQERLKAIKVAKETTDEINNAGAADVDAGLTRWMSDKR